jgi:hypothetical protein
MAVVKMSATTARVANLWSAGTMYQGAHSVLVTLRASSYAAVYWAQKPRSDRSEAENFQCFSGFSNRSRERRFGSFLETFWSDPSRCHSPASGFLFWAGRETAR